MPGFSNLASAPLILADVDLVTLLSASKGIVLGVVLILLAMIVLCFFVICYKWIVISQAQSQSITFLDRFWTSKRLDEIYQVASQLRSSPLAQMFTAGYIELSKIKKGQTSDSMHDKMNGTENIERALNRARVSEMTKLENMMPILATTGSAAPFIGLFGTVWGIMDAFLAIAKTGSAELGAIAQPIAEALVTTALALASAVPAVVFYNFFNRRLRVLSAEMQTFGSDYLNIVRRHFF